MAVMTFSENTFSPLASSSKSSKKSQNSSKKSQNKQNVTADQVDTGNVPLNSSPKVPQTEDTGKTKLMNEVQGIPVLNLDEGRSEQPETRWVIRRGGRDVPIMSTINEEEEFEDILQFTSEDVKKEVAFWNHSVVCYILGANPPWDVIEDYVFNVWDQFGVDRVSFMDNGVFLVRLKRPEQRDALLNSGYYLFENKPIIVKPWNSEAGLVKGDVDIVPVWIRMTGIPLKFWGDCLSSIAGLVGKFVKKDELTTEKIRLSYARVLVELHMG
ncbi:uncharacterized protein LOC141589957 [Silene latifolia]|uniref:uncharacterized protein LOC141589957 n=1 Tax=Silene latifolia TaxID=37657 RepID=UPI003D76D4D3